MTRKLKWLLTLTALATLGGCAWLDHKQGEWIFRPTEGNWRGYDANTAATDGFSDVWLTHANGEKVHAWYLPTEVGDSKKAPTLLYLHGARWNVSGSSPRLKRWASWGFNVLAIDYRGFGRSEAGTPSEKKSYEDAQLAWQWLSQREPDAKKRYIFGHSLGGAIAIDLATKVNDEAAVIVEATFTNMYDMAHTTPAKWLPVSLMLTQKFDSLDKIGKVGSPILIAHGTNDTLIPVEMSKRLFEKAVEPKQLMIVEGASHHSVGYSGAEQYKAALDKIRALNR